jgi:hypothetical protein
LVNRTNSPKRVVRPVPDIAKRNQSPFSGAHSPTQHPASGKDDIDVQISMVSDVSDVSDAPRLIPQRYRQPALPGAPQLASP